MCSKVMVQRMKGSLKKFQKADGQFHKSMRITTSRISVFTLPPKRG